MQDVTLAWGSMRMTAGRAWSLSSADQPVPVAKTWQTFPGITGQYLTESAPYSLLKAQIDALPNASLSPGNREAKTVETALRQRPVSPMNLSTNAIQIAEARPDDDCGVVLDWLLISSASLNINFGGGSGKSGPAAIGQGESDYWNWCNDPGDDPISMSGLLWSDSSDAGVSLEVDNGPGAWGNNTGDPMYDTYIYPWSGDINVWLSGIPGGTYDFYIYSHGPANNGNSVLELWSDDTSYGQKGTTMWGPGWNSANWEEGQQYVVYRNVSVSDGGTVMLDVMPGAAGLAILNGMQIVPSDAVSHDPPGMYQAVDINFGGYPQKTGLAAVGLTTGDAWNWFNFPGQSSAALVNLALAGGASTSAGVKATNGPGYWGNSTGDAMYDTYIYQYGSHIGVILTNLSSYGLTYDFYVYGHGPADNANGVFQLTTGGTTHGPRGTTIWGEAWNSASWEEGQQYVVFRNIAVPNGQPVFIDVAPGWSGYSIINGVQAVVPWDRDGNGLPDWWEMKYFGSVGIDPNADYDGDGTSNLNEYLNHTDPNKIRFIADFSEDHVTTTTPSGTIQVLGGVPAQMAVLVNSTNFASAVWQPFSTSVAASLGPSDGRYEIWIALKGLPADAEQTWEMTPIYLDRTAPLIVITNPVALTTSRPMIQLQGYSPEPLSSIRFDLANAAGTVTDLPGFVLDQHYDTNLHTFTTNTFQCFDIPLTNGVNTITLRAIDLAGNTTTITRTYTLDFSGDATPPALTLYWPQNAARLSGSAFTLRGILDDPTATITAQITDASLNTTAIDGIVERDGLFWVEDLPLSAGANSIILTATDAAGNAATTSITVTQSDLSITIDDVPDDQLHNWTVDVTGTIGAVTGYKLWVNGRGATINSGGIWSAPGVRLNAGGTAIIQARAIPTSDNGGNGSGGGGTPTYQDSGNPASASARDAEAQKSKPMRFYLERYDEDWGNDRYSTNHVFENDGGSPGASLDWGENIWREKGGQHWIDGTNGSSGYWNLDQSDRGQYLTLQTNHCSARVDWPASDWPNPAYGDWTVNGDCTGPLYTGHKQPELCFEHCEASVTNDLDELDLIGDPESEYYMDFQKVIEHNKHWRTAQAKLKLFIGGKGVPARQNLFSFSGSATEIVNKWAYGYSASDQDKRAIASAEVAIGDLGKLGSDGWLYKALPDGVTKDVTPRTSRKFYTFALSPTKHHLRMVVNGTIPLADDRVVNLAKFCVGQKLNFSAYFAPDVPGLASANPRWNFTGKYVNDHYTDDNGCEIYQIAPYWVTQNPTRVWYYRDGQALKAYLGMYCIFNNGQTAYVARQGWFDMYRPTLSNFQVTGQPALYVFYPPGGITRLSLGDAQGDGAMGYSMHFNCQFAGQAGLTQVFDDQSYPVSYGPDVLDVAEFYLHHADGEYGTKTVNAGQLSVLSLIDEPWEPCYTYYGTASLVLQFRDFVRFRPDAGNASENIFVTVGKIASTVNGHATLVDDSWVLDQGGTVTGPSLSDSDDWPFWTFGP